MASRTTKSIHWAAAALLLISASLAQANGYNRAYKVTITNITKGQTFTPQLVATHDGSVRAFRLGDPASPEIEAVAEGGNTGPLTDQLLAKSYRVGDVQTIPGMLGPGESATIVVEGTRFHRFMTVAAMLLPTNDTFVALNRVGLPRWGSRTYTALGYDAGTEFNDQNCVNIPGPRCGGAPFSDAADTDEGFIYVSNGFHDLPPSDIEGKEVLGPFVYDWRNPIARITVKRLH